MVREQVIRELKRNPHGYTITELASKLNTTRNTISSILAFLEGARKVSVRQAGMAKIHYWHKKDLISSPNFYSAHFDVVVDKLKKNSEGFTITELASQLQTTRNSIAIIFSYLEGANRLSIRQAGMAKIHYWKKKRP